MRLNDGNFVVEAQVAQAAVKSVARHLANQTRNLHAPRRIFMVALCNTADHYIFALLFLSSIFFYSSPNHSGRRLDVYRTSTHGVAL